MPYSGLLMSFHLGKQSLVAIARIVLYCDKKEDAVSVDECVESGNLLNDLLVVILMKFWTSGQA